MRDASRVQRLAQTAEGEAADDDRHQQPQQRHHGRAAPNPFQVPRPGRARPRRAVEHHIQVPRRAQVAGARREHRGAEDARRFAARRTHRVGTAQGERGAAQKSTHRVQVHLRLLHHARVADVGVDPACGIQHIDLHAGVDHHQHRQQRSARFAFGLVLVPVQAGATDLGPVFDDVAGQSVRQPLQRLFGMLVGHMPAQQAHQHAIGQQQQCQRQGQSRGEGTAAFHAGAAPAGVVAKR